MAAAVIPGAAVIAKAVDTPKARRYWKVRDIRLACVTIEEVSSWPNPQRAEIIAPGIHRILILGDILEQSATSREFYIIGHDGESVQRFYEFISPAAADHCERHGFWRNTYVVNRPITLDSSRAVKFKVDKLRMLT